MDKETNIDILIDISIVIQRLKNKNKKIRKKENLKPLRKETSDHFIHRVLNYNVWTNIQKPKPIV